MPPAFFRDQSFMTFTDGGEPAEQEPSSVLHSAILWVFLQPSILKAAVLSITLSALYYVFFFFLVEISACTAF